MKIITSKAELQELARELGVRADWHEPDEQGLTARVEGGTFDNAGFWPTRQAMQFSDMGLPSVELHVILSKEDEGHCDECGSSHGSEDVAAINVATLLAWACDTAE